MAEAIVMGETHRTVNKNFEKKIRNDGQKLLLNLFEQETIVNNLILGFSKTLKGPYRIPEKIEVKIQKLYKPVKTNAHTYPKILLC